ncbi:hypothetical protein ABZ508_33235 [Streptomyces lavendulocolor]|uniref:Uncharacterized protein n=1 Tax=Streptomyces lavendulocolor TaxID=67316 RepID=A0ABV2WFT3_9ACTN
MNTTTAAAEAKVTVATIRTWCRIGAVAAAKVAGRWVIDTASLARRVAIGAMKRPATQVQLTADDIIRLGGRRWQKGDMDRVYLNDWQDYIQGVEIDYYKTGNVCGAAIDGRGIANGRVAALLGAVRKVYFDSADGLLHINHYGADCVEIRYLDGQRTHLNLVARIFAGIKAAVAAAR